MYRKCTLTVSILAAAVLISLAGANNAGAAPDIPSDLPPSPLFGTLDFSQQMLRFEEFAVRPVPDGTQDSKNFPPPVVTASC